MNERYMLNMNMVQAVKRLDRWASHAQRRKQEFEVHFDKELGLGQGVSLISPIGSMHEIYIGIGDLPTKFPMNYKPLSDDSFIRLGIVLFHEITHCHQRMSEKFEITASEISTYKNPNYYMNSWPELPHEINAEFTGVMSMWNVLDEEFPGTADTCMLHFVNRRAANTDYMVKCPNDGFVSRTQVEDAFDQAYEKSLDQPRRFQPGFLRYEDEVSKLLTNESILRPEYQAHYKKLVGNVPGTEKDRMMAALTLHLHPELVDEYPMSFVRALNAETVFGLPMPESSDESRTYLLNPAFASEIDRLSNPSVNNLAL